MLTLRGNELDIDVTSASFMLKVADDMQAIDNQAEVIKGLLNGDDEADPTQSYKQIAEAIAEYCKCTSAFFDNLLDGNSAEMCGIKVIDSAREWGLLYNEFIYLQIGTFSEVAMEQQKLIQETLQKYAPVGNTPIPGITNEPSNS